MPFIPAVSLRDVTGVALTFQADGTWVADYCRVHRRKALVTVTQQGEGLYTGAAMQQALGPEPAAVAMALAGRGVLLRTLPLVSEGQPAAYAEALAAALPGVNLADFYIQYQPTSVGVQAALIRKTVVDELLTELQAVGLWVVTLSLGAASVAALLPYLPASMKQQPLRAGNFLLYPATDGAQFSRIDYQPSTTPADQVTYPVGNEQLSAAQLLPYSAALSALVGPVGGTEQGSAVPRADELAREWGYRRWFQRLRLAVPVAILVLLLGNFLASQQLTTERGHLTARLGNNQQLLEHVQELRQATALKHAFLTTSGWAQPSWNALCADRLAASLPAGLDLLSLEINPPQDPAVAAGKPAAFRHDVVIVRGQCHDAQRFNAWLQVISKLPWVQAVRDQNFTYDYAGGVGVFTFTLVVKPTILLRS